MASNTSIHHRIATRLSAVLVVIVAASAVLMGLAITHSGTDLLVKAAIERLVQESRLVSVRLEDILGSARRDIEFIASSPAVNEAALSLNSEPGNVERQGRAMQASQRLEELFAAMLSNHPWYYQVRLIGVENSGLEIVRVKRSGTEILHFRDDELQQKGERDYFRETLDVPPGKVYWSNIELSREHGQIAEPHFPVLRVSMPVAGRYGKTFGIVIIDLDISRIFNEVNAVLPPDMTLYIANDQGDYLYQPDAERTFGFEFGQHFRIQDDFGAGELPIGKASMIIEDVTPPGSREALVAHISRLSMNTREGDSVVLGLTRPRTEILSDVNQARQHTIALIIPFILFSVFIVIWLVQVFTGPLARFTREVGRFEAGRSIHLPEQNRNDEVGKLAQAFVRMTERINRQVRQMEEQGHRFQSLFEAVPDAVVIIDENGSVEFSNPAAERLFGYSSDELLGKNVSVLMPEPYHSHHDGYIRRYLETGEAHIIGVGRKVVGKHRNGKTMQLYLSIGEFMEEGRRKFTGILHDISLQYGETGKD